MSTTDMDFTGANCEFCGTPHIPDLDPETGNCRDAEACQRRQQEEVPW